MIKKLLLISALLIIQNAKTVINTITLKTDPKMSTLYDSIKIGPGSAYQLLKSTIPVGQKIYPNLVCIIKDSKFYSFSNAITALSNPSSKFADGTLLDTSCIIDRAKSIKIPNITTETQYDSVQIFNYLHNKKPLIIPLQRMIPVSVNIVLSNYRIKQISTGNFFSILDIVNALNNNLKMANGSTFFIKDLAFASSVTTDTVSNPPTNTGGSNTGTSGTGSTDNSNLSNPPASALTPAQQADAAALAATKAATDKAAADANAARLADIARVAAQQAASAQATAEQKAAADKAAADAAAAQLAATKAATDKAAADANATQLATTARIAAEQAASISAAQLGQGYSLHGRYALDKSHGKSFGDKIYFQGDLLGSSFTCYGYRFNYLTKISFRRFDVYHFQPSSTVQ